MVVLCAYVYWAALPASHDWIFGGPTDRILGDGSDLRAVGWQYGVIRQAFRDHPTSVLYGALYTPLRDFPRGAAIWVTWIERPFVLLVGPFTTFATENTVVTMALWIVNGSAFLWFARVMGWHRLVSLGLALAFAVNPFTRARGSVHTALAGTFFLPLIFGAIEVCAKSNRNAFDRRAASRSAIALFFAATAAQYFVLITAVLTPLLVWFSLRRMRVHGGIRLARVGTLVAACLPAILLLAWSMVPPPSAKSEPGPRADRTENTKYLEAYGAQPIDYFTGDIKLGNEDILKKRKELTDWVLEHPVDANTHERANGVRWVLWASAIVAIGWAAIRRRDPIGSRSWIIACAIVAGAAFLLSLAPNGLQSYGHTFAPSALVFKALPSLRVVNRYGVFVFFAVACMAGEFWSRTVPTHRFLTPVFGALFALICAFEMLPMQPMTMSPLRRVRTELAHPDGSCGGGIFMPFNPMTDYWAFEETRGTRCALVNPITESRMLPLTEVRIDDPRRFARWAQCSRISWVVLRDAVGAISPKRVCDELGWEMVSEDSCRARSIQSPRRNPENCW